ncbi:MAG TPA: phenylalanine--tRNA ligase subunit beta [Candidatus Saccharimonadales bacterium]|nr:phenylalanine--tRNA ligase subunit beta [Candidatus Saccharimonadales bacterium]
MKVSLNHIRHYRDKYNWSDDPAPDGVDALVQKIGAQLAAVEEVTRVGDRYKDAVVVKVVACEDHPNADRLHVCWVDDGRQVKNVTRGKNDLVQIVCGAPNVRAGMLAVWLPPGSTVPNTVGKDPFMLEARELRGVVSNGMLASPKELGIGDSHEGILELQDDEATPGTTFAKAVGLQDDVVIDMENKMFTHRPDLFGLIGIARELAGIQGQAFKSPDWYRPDAVIDEPTQTALPLEVKNELPELVPRFVAFPVSNVAIKPSPAWLQVALNRLGVRPINNIVDLTNYYMMVTSQPIHAYDYDKVKAFSGGDKAVLTVRHPKQGETIRLLNGKTITPRPQAMMVAAGDKLACVGGMMGGAETEVDHSTKNVIFEAATWDMYEIRRTSMANGIFTDAVTRFNKGQSPLQNVAVLKQLLGDVVQLTGGKLAAAAIDDNHVPQDVRERGNLHSPVIVTATFINERLGWDLSPKQMATLLTNVEFGVDVKDNELTVAAPFWRTDIAIPEDIVEEIGRLHGYDHLPLDLPVRDLTPAPKNSLLQVKSRIRDLLVQAGANEVLTYSFVHGNLLDKVGQNRELAFQLSNALSPELQYMRLSLSPSLLEKVHPNVKAGYDQFALFELGKVHNKTELDEDGLPREGQGLSFVYAAAGKTAADHDDAPFYQARKTLVDLLAAFGVLESLRFVPLKDGTHPAGSWLAQVTSPYEPNRSALIKDEKGRVWGVVGEYRAGVRKQLKLPDFTAGFEFDPLLFIERPATSGYIQLPRFPKVEQDICLRVPASTTYHQTFDFVWTHLNGHRPDATYHTLGPIDIYQKDGDTDHKQITLRLSIASYERTLTDGEVNGLLDNVATAAKQALGAERV